MLKRRLKRDIFKMVLKDVIKMTFNKILEISFYKTTFGRLF